jgi:hypothetical protein
MTWFVESPWPSLMLGFGLEVVLAIALVRTGRAILIAAMVALLALTASLLVIERMVVTEFEAVEDSLDAVARALESGDVPAVMTSFTPTCPRRGEVEAALSRFTIREAHVGGDLEVRINRLTLPPSATAYFTGRVEGKDKRGVVPYEHMIRKFKVTLHKQGDRWLIADYSDADFRDRSDR